MLAREVDIRPSRAASRKSPQVTAEPDLFVREEDLRRCGGNLEELKRYHLPAIKGAGSEGAGASKSRRQPTRQERCAAALSRGRSAASQLPRLAKGPASPAERATAPARGGGSTPDSQQQRAPRRWASTPTLP